MSDSVTQKDIVVEFYFNNPNRDIEHKEVVDWVTKEYHSRTGKVFRVPDRQIRKLAQNGFLIKVSKGVYRYEPDNVNMRELEDFTQAQKNEILERDGYRCVICGRGKAEGVELHVDHIKPKDLGGTATIENGQTLCTQHNFQKKNFKQTETGKKMFIRLYELSKKAGDNDLMRFCEDILEVFERNNINGHIEWNK
jgi:hypothetical protein